MKSNVKKLNLKKYRRLVIIVLLVALTLFCAFTFISNAADISRLNAKNEEYSQQLKTQEEENEKVKAILDSDNKDEYIEQKAREKGYVKEGETVYYDISSSK